MPNHAIQKRPNCEKCLELRTSFSSIGELAQLREVTHGADIEITQLKPGMMQGIRLNHVRSELEREIPSTTTITSAALRAGFFHLGRFSQEYKSFFGELPSMTLLRVNSF